MTDVYDIRDAPTAAFASSIRELYPTEAEVGRMLTRKMERRSGPPHAPVTLAELSASVQALVAEDYDGPFQVRDERWLSGGASKLQMRFTLERVLDGRPVVSDLVVRMEPTESINASSRQREYELLAALSGTVPVPEVYWVDAEGAHFREPALIYSYTPGAAKPSVAAGGVTGLGTNFGPELRAVLAPQFVEHLARIHTFDHTMADLPSFSRPTVGTTQSAEWQVNRGQRIWEEDRGEELALMDVAASWLRRNLPVLDHVSVVHGDYRAGNFLYNESTKEITSILDWERAYLGDRHRDLAWSTARVIGHMAEDGKTYLVCGLMPVEEFYDRYQEASGLEIDEERLRFYRILNRYQQVQTLLGSAYRVVRLGKSHQNVVVARLEGPGYLLAEELRAALEEVL